MNEENKKQVIILVILLAVLAFFVFKTINTISPTAGGAVNTATTPAPDDMFKDTDIEAINVNIETLQQNIQHVEFIYAENTAARNPSQPTTGILMEPVQPGPGEPPELSDNPRSIAQLKKVTGIIWDESSPMAVVDNEVVDVGYEFRYKIFVKSIGVDHVVFSFKTPDGEDDEVTKQLVKEQ